MTVNIEDFNGNVIAVANEDEELERKKPPPFEVVFEVVVTVLNPVGESSRKETFFLSKEQKDAMLFNYKGFLMGRTGDNVVWGQRNDKGEVAYLPNDRIRGIYITEKN